MKKIFLFLVLGAIWMSPGAGRLSAQADEDPITVPVHVNSACSWISDYAFYQAFSMSLQGEPSSPTASDGRVAFTSPNSSNTTDREVTRMVPDKLYSLSVSSAGMTSGSVSIIAAPGYTTLVNGVPCPTVSGSCTVQIVSSRRSAVARSGVASSLARNHVYWQVSLGSLQNGSSAGWISLNNIGYASDLSALFTPAALQYQSGSPEVSVYNSSGNLNQVRANDVFVNVVTINSTSYELDFYNPSLVTGSGFPYSFSGQQYVSYIISEGTGANQLTITSKTYNGTSTVVRTAVTTLTRTGSSWPYTWTVNDWATSGTTAPVNVAVTNGQSTSTSTPETIAVKDGSGTVATNTTRQYTQFSWGPGLTSVTQGTSNSNLAAYQYYTSSGANESYGFVQSTSVNGHWVGYEYQSNSGYDGNDGIISKIHRQYLSASTTVPSTLSGDTTGAVTSYTYTQDAYGVYSKPTLIQTVYGGTTIGYSTISYEGFPTSSTTSVTLNGMAEVVADRTDRTNDSGPVSLSSETRYYREDVSDAFYTGRPCLVVRPDGTEDTYAYQRGTYSGGTYSFSGVVLSGGTWNCTRSMVIHGTTQSSGNTQITSVDSYSLEPVYLVASESTRDIEIRDQYAHVVSTETDVWTGSAWQAVQTSTYAYNSANQLTSLTTNNGEISTTKSYTGEQLSSDTDAAGVVASYSYDNAGRVSSVTKTASSSSLSALATAINYDAASDVTSRVVGSSITSSATYDDAGRATQTVDPNTGTTTYSYSPSTWTTTTTLPNGGTKVDTTYADGHLVSETGTGVVPRYFSYSTDSSTGYLTTTINYATSTSARYEAAVADLLGRTVSTKKPTFNSTSVIYTVQNTYDSTTGHLTQTTRSDGTNSLAPLLYQYDAMGQCTRQGLAISGDNPLGLSSTDRITDTIQNILENSGVWWKTTTTTTYPTASSSSGFTTSIVRDRLTGFTSGVLADRQVTDAYGTVTEITTVASTSDNTVTTTTTNPGFNSSSPAKVVTVAGLTTSENGFDGLATTIGYDSLWRPVTQTDSRGNAITTSYNSGTAQVASTTDAASNALASYTYDSAGRVIVATNAGSKATRMNYNDLNEVTEQWGDVPFPVQYSYDSYGQRTTMYTYQSGSSWGSSSWPGGSATGTTTWTYDTGTGLLSSKTDPSSHAVSYTYNTFGQTYQRTWSRGTVSTYAYDSHTGELTGITYSDSTPSVSYAYTRSGQLSTVGDVTGSRTFKYDSSINSNPLEMESEELDNSFYGGRYLSRLYNTSSTVTGGSFGPYSATSSVAGRPIGFQLGSSENSSGDLYQSYAYTDRGLFAGVHAQTGSGSARNFAYTYLTSSGVIVSSLVAGYSDYGNSFSTSRTYESNRDLLSTIQGKWSSSVHTEFDYVHNGLYQTSSVVQTGSAFTPEYGSTSSGATFRLMTYDNRGEVTADIGYLGNNTSSTTSPLPDRNFSYAYDAIGDRTSSNYSSSGTYAETYSLLTSGANNGLNQYTERDNFSVPVSGSIVNNTSANVVLGTTSTLLLAGRQGAFWAGEAVPPLSGGSPVNVSGPATFTLTLTAGLPGSPNDEYETTQSLTIPPQHQAFTYDTDGNMTADNMWSYTYDAENRLIQMSSASGLPSVTLNFKYDYLGRRVEKANGTTTDRYIYDGWNLVADYRYSSGLSLYRTFTWGLDVTGSLKAAGGVGALIELTNCSGTPTDYFPTYDGSGNVASLASSSADTVSAVYEYSPFGEPLQALANDSTVADNPFRFSTKFTDSESGLIYYGNRFYSPSLGRFLNRDPMEEAGGINLYGFVNNSPANAYDVLGCDPDSYWRDQGMGTIGGGSAGQQDALIASINSGAASMGVENAANALYNDPKFGQPLESTQGGHLTDIGYAIEKFVGGIFSTSSSSGGHFKVTFGPLKVVPLATAAGMVTTAPTVFLPPATGGSLAEAGIAILRTAGTALATSADALLAPLAFLMTPTKMGTGDMTHPVPLPPVVIPNSVDASHPVPSIPNDPSQPPGPDWVWKGDGAPGSSQGSWVDPNTGQTLYPDLNHLPPIGPHWDWTDPSGNQWRVPPGGGIPTPKN